MQRFAIGSALGALWEAPLSCPGWMQEPGRLLRLLRPRSLAFFSIWCFWDGLILLVRLSRVVSAQLPPASGRFVRVLWSPADMLGVPELMVDLCASAACFECTQVGVWLCQLLASTNGLLPFGTQLAVHVLWGQASSLLVEWAAAASGMWAYQPAGWNRSIAQLSNGKHLTLLPQIIWLLASTAFCILTWRLPM